MPQEGPTGVLYDASGNVLATNDGAVPGGTAGLMVSGFDGTDARRILVDTSGRPLVKITDGTNVPAVKAASTYTTATDPALVVAISPNSTPQPVQVGSGTITAVTQTVVMDAGGAVVIQIAGTWVGTLQFEGTDGDGSWVTIPAISGATSTFVTTTTVNAPMQMNAAGFVQVRVISTAWTSGTATISWSATANSHVMFAYSPNATNFQATAQLSDGTNSPVAVKAASTAAVAADKALVVAISPNSGVKPYQRTTYTVGVSNFGIAGAPTDVALISGSASTVVRITHVLISVTSTTAVVIPVTLVKRSAANTGGSSGIGAITPLDSNDAASTASNLFYATNPTALGAAVGTMVRAAKYFCEVATPTSAAEVLDWPLGNNDAKPVVLRGTAQTLCVNFGGVTIAGGTVTIVFEYTEDAT
jgi:hypothetical protein